MVKSRERMRGGSLLVGRPKGPPTANITVRMLSELKKEIEETARRESRSVSNMILRFIQEGLADREKKAKKKSAP